MAEVGRNTNEMAPNDNPIILFLSSLVSLLVLLHIK